MSRIPYVNIAPMNDDDIRILEETARQQGGIPRRDSLPRSPPNQKRKHSCSGRIMALNDSELDKSLEEFREEDARLERDAKKLREWQPEQKSRTRGKDSTKETASITTRTQEQKKKEREEEKIREEVRLKRKEAEKKKEIENKKETEQKEREAEKLREEQRKKRKEAEKRKEEEAREKRDKEDSAEKMEEEQAGEKPKQNDKEDNTGQRREEETEDTVRRINTARDRIIAATTRYSGSKLSFNKEEQTTVREEIDILTGLMIQFAYKIGKMEPNLTSREGNGMEEVRRGIYEIKKTMETQYQQQTQEIDELKKQIGKRVNNTEKPRRIAPTQDNTTNEEGGEITDTQTDGETEDPFTIAQGRRRGARTYAQIANTNKEEAWKTPEHKDRLEARIAMGNETDAKKIREAVKEATREEIVKTRGLKNIITTRNGQLILQYKDAQQRDEINAKLRQKPDLQIRTKDRTLPKMTLTGVLRGYTDIELLTMINDENQDIKSNFEQDILRQTKILTRKTCRNEQKENITMETTPELFKHLVKKERLYLDMVTIYVEETVSVALCYNCHKYGHVSKHCRDKQTCHICGGDHAGTDCTRDEDCPNCRASRISPELRRHTARDRNCPCYVRKEKQARNEIDYGRGNREEGMHVA